MSTLAPSTGRRDGGVRGRGPRVEVASQGVEDPELRQSLAVEVGLDRDREHTDAVADRSPEVDRRSLLEVVIASLQPKDRYTWATRGCLDSSSQLNRGHGFQNRIQGTGENANLLSRNNGDRSRIEKALDILMLQTKNFYKPIDEYTLLVAPDTRQKRQEYEDQVIRTFFLSNADT